MRRILQLLIGLNLLVVLDLKAMEPAAPTSDPISDYIKQSRIVQSFVGTNYDEVASIVEKSMRVASALAQSPISWIREVIPSIEAFYGEFYHRDINLTDNHLQRIERLFRSRQPLDIREFRSFSNAILICVPENYQESCRLDLLQIYIAFPDPTQRSVFETFCAGYIGKRCNSYNRIKIYHDILSIYNNFTTDHERHGVIASYRESAGNSNLKDIRHFLPIHTLNTNTQKLFHDFCQDAEIMHCLQRNHDVCVGAFWSIFLAFPDANNDSDHTFWNFCSRYNTNLSPRDFFAQVAKFMVPFFNLDQNPEHKRAFYEFYQTCYVDMQYVYVGQIVEYLLPPYHYFQRNPAHVKAFASCTRTCILRSADQQAPVFYGLWDVYRRTGRMSQVSEFVDFFNWHSRATGSICTIFDLLPIFMNNLRNDFGDFMNPHISLIDNSMRTQEIELFKKDILTKVVKSYMRQDYLQYVRVMAILRSMQSRNIPVSQAPVETFEQHSASRHGKARNITPPTALDGQEIADSTKVLEASSGKTKFSSPLGISTHGLAFSTINALYKRSSDDCLRSIFCSIPLLALADDNEEPEENGQTVLEYIQEEGVNLRRILTDTHKHELWRRYEAYFDDLYGRTKTHDGRYVKNSYTCEIATNGDLIRPYQDDGSLRPTPELVYPGWQFWVIEAQFVNLLKK